MPLDLLVALLNGPADQPDLGARLRDAADQLCRARLPPERLGPVLSWRKSLGGFERLPATQKRYQLALGLRLCRGLRGLALPRIVPPAPAPPASADPLEAPSTSIPGIGPALAQRLAERGLETVEDLAWFVPRRYDDLRNVVPLAEAVTAGPGARTPFVAQVKRARSAGRWRRYVEVRLEDGSVDLVARWFNVHGSMARRFVAGARVVLSGVLRERDGELGLVNPELLGDPDDEATS